MSAAPKLPTFDELYAEILALPQGSTGEILGPGDWRTMARPGGRHALVSRKLARSLEGCDRMFGGTGWWIEVEREIRLDPEHLFVPDLAGWRVDEPPDFVDDNPITVTPDWVCEILSRSTQRADRAVKLPVYAACGVGHVWVVDPEGRTLEVYETGGGRPIMVAALRGEASQVLPPFSELFDVGALWKPSPKR